MKFFIFAKRKSEYIYSIIFIIVFFLTTLFFNEIRSGLAEGLKLCINTTIPTLFPFILLSDLINRYGLPQWTYKFAHKPMNYLFGLSGNCLTCVLTGLSGGYLSGVTHSANLLGRNIIDKEQASRIAMFYTSPGLSFCIYFAGITIYNSRDIGVRLLLSDIIAALIASFSYNLLKPNKSKCTNIKANESFGTALINATEATSKILIKIVIWILLFDYLRLISDFTVKNGTVKFLINYLCEVTSSLRYTRDRLSIGLAAFPLTFGGLCIIFQQTSLNKIIGLKIKNLLVAKIIKSAISSIIFNLLNFIFPIDIPANAGNFRFKISYHSAIGSVTLFFSVIIFIIAVSKQKISVMRHKKL